MPNEVVGLRISSEEFVAECTLNALRMLGDSVETNLEKRKGIPVLKGTRFTIAQLLAEIADGRNIVDISVDFELDLQTIRHFLEGLSLYLDRPTNR